jgi:hypothetical protein
VPDLTRVEQLIGYRPTMTLDDILRQVAEHTLGTLEAARS